MATLLVHYFFQFVVTAVLCTPDRIIKPLQSVVKNCANNQAYSLFFYIKEQKLGDEMY